MDSLFLIIYPLIRKRHSSTDRSKSLNLHSCQSQTHRPLRSSHGSSAWIQTSHILGLMACILLLIEIFSSRYTSRKSYPGRCICNSCLALQSRSEPHELRESYISVHR